jgi:hypothetical protein
VNIPRAWAQASGEGRTPDQRTLPVTTWGWGDDDDDARREAAGRLQRLLERITRGDPFPPAYGYGTRPLREEILETVAGPPASPPVAVLTRNAYGAVVLNTARVLFLDIDRPPATFLERLGGLLGRERSAGDVVPDTLRAALGASGATFRVYRTASGLRAMAIDREFEPAGPASQALMTATATDPAFARLCAAQHSFRARLTPKPWRCRCTAPPGHHPRVDDGVRRRFAAWLGDYEQASRRHATCRYLETIGTGRATTTARRLVEVHDRLTRCHEALPLA